MKSLHAMVHEAAVNHGDKTAAIFDTGTSPASCLTYDQLLALGNELCKNVQGAIGENEQVIGVFCDVNILLPVWIFGFQHYSFPSLELRGPNLFQHNNAPVHKVSSMKTWCVKVGVEELECPAQSPDLNPTEHLWDELEHQLNPRPPHQHQCLISLMLL
ncbi:hypothetical protein PGIGA_G00096420 [Pangasianodon gigas]|uniref:Uncharacterized protein n=1 Tax=Pangasianodon gigas TaxID=30993 RepID=A0ACC5XDU0_PANGG|nr:hypothetical protein [Pangasianodon gigas]